MPSKRSWISGLVIATAAGCVDEPPAPKITGLDVVMRWDVGDTRSVEVAIQNPEIPCTETEGGFLGESPVQCQSAPWSLTVDGKDVTTSAVSCWSAYDGLFGHVAKRCEGGVGRVNVDETAPGEDIEIIATSDGDETRVVVTGVRKPYAFVQEKRFDRGQPGVVHVEGLDLENEAFTALYSRTQQGSTLAREAADVGEGNRLLLSPFGLEDGVYRVRVLALAFQPPNVRIAVPVEGALTIGP